MNIINVTVRGKMARAEGRARVVCGNSDYTVRFDFDEEWSEYFAKTARFVTEDGSYTDVQFEGSDCTIPILRNTRTLLVGVFAGNLRTTTAALIHAVPCITDPDGTPADPTPDVYAQLMERFNAMEAPAAILYEKQDLTAEQQATARENIGVATPDWEQSDEGQPDYIKNRPFYEVVTETLLDPTIENWRKNESVYCSWRVAGVDYIDVHPSNLEHGAGFRYELGDVAVEVYHAAGFLSIKPSDADVHILKREPNIKQIDPKFIPERLFDATGATNAEITAALQENKLCYVRDADGFWFCNSYDYNDGTEPYYSAAFYHITEGSFGSIDYTSKRWTSDNGFDDKRVVEGVSTLTLKDMAMTVVDAYDEITPQSVKTVNGICVGAGSGQGGKVPPSGMTFPIIFSLGPTSHGTGSAWIRDAAGVIWKGSTDYGTLRVRAVPANHFVVRVIRDDNGNLTADKTIAEIVAAYKEGKDVVASFTATGPEFQLTALTLGESGNIAVFDVSQPGLMSAGLYIDDDGVELTDDLYIPKIYPVEATNQMNVPVGVDSDGKLWSKADTSLGMTGATVGQIAKITAVDDSGKPTAWKAVDMPSGGGGDLSWIEVVDITTAEQTQKLTISVDKDGRPISQYNALWMVFSILFPADATQMSNNGAPWIYPFPKTGDNAYRYITTVASWKTIKRTLTYAWAGLPRITWSSATSAQTIFDVDGDPDFLSGLCVYLPSSSDHIPAGTRVRIAVLSKGVTA